MLFPQQQFSTVKMHVIALGRDSFQRRRGCFFQARDGTDTIIWVSYSALSPLCIYMQASAVCSCLQPCRLLYERWQGVISSIYDHRNAILTAAVLYRKIT